MPPTNKRVKFSPLPLLSTTVTTIGQPFPSEILFVFLAMQYVLVLFYCHVSTSALCTVLAIKIVVFPTSAQN